MKLTNKHKIVRVYNQYSLTELWPDFLTQNATFIKTSKDTHFSLTSPIISTPLTKYEYNYKGNLCSYSRAENGKIVKASLHFNA